MREWEVGLGWGGVWGTVLLPPGISISHISYHKSNIGSGGWSSRCWGQNAITGHGSRDQGTKAMPWWHPSKCEDDAKCGRKKKMLQWTLAVTFSCRDSYSNISPLKIIQIFNKIFNKIQDVIIIKEHSAMASRRKERWILQIFHRRDYTK